MYLLFFCLYAEKKRSLELFLFSSTVDQTEFQLIWTNDDDTIQSFMQCIRKIFDRLIGNATSIVTYERVILCASVAWFRLRICSEYYLSWYTQICERFTLGPQFQPQNPLYHQYRLLNDFGYNWTVNSWVITVANWKEFMLRFYCVFVSVYAPCLV